MSGLYNAQGMMPKQAIKEWTDDDYRRNLNFIASMWNRRMYNYTLDASGAVQSTDDARYVQSYLQNAQYFFGRQATSDFGFILKDELGNTTKFPMVRGMDITKIVNHVNGVVRKMVENLPKTVNVTAFSQDAVSQKKEIMNLIRLKAREKEFFKIVQMETGFGFQPINKDFQTDEELDRYLEDFQESMEVAYQNLAKHILITNRYLQLFPQISNYISIGGLGAIHVYEHGGKIRWKVIPPESYIPDMSKNDDQHEEDDYGGYLEAMSVPDLIDQFEWTEAEIKDLETMAKSQTMWAQYNTYVGVNGLYWWQMNNGVPKVMVCRGQWRSMEWMDGEWVEVLREGVIVGNKYLKNCKVSDGQVWNKFFKDRKRLHFRVVTPNTILGTNLGIVGMLKRYQDIKDAFATKATELASRAIGKSYVINASKLPEGLTSADVVSQLKQSNLIVLEGADIDEDVTKRQSLVEAVDLTLDPSVKYYIDMVTYYDQVISDIINIPAPARGMNDNYQSATQVNMNIQQSTMGMSWFYQNIMIFIKNLLEYSADYAKLILPEKANSDISLVVGDTAVELFKVEEMKKMQFEDFLLDIRPDDIMTEQEKAGLKEFASALAQSGQLKISDYIKVLQLNDKNQIYNYFEKVEKKRELREEMMQQQQLEAQQAQAEAANQTQENIASIQANAGLEKQAMQNQQKIQDEDPLGLR